MAKARRDRLTTWEDVERILAAWVEILGLQQWEINLEKNDRTAPWLQPPDDLARGDEVNPVNSAQLNRAADYKIARIWLSPEYETWSVYKTSRTICHELMHCVFREIEWTTDLLTNRIPDEAKSFFDGAFGHALEGTVEHLAQTFVDRLGVQ